MEVPQWLVGPFKWLLHQWSELVNSEWHIDWNYCSCEMCENPVLTLPPGDFVNLFGVKPHFGAWVLSSLRCIGLSSINYLSGMGYRDSGRYQASDTHPPAAGAPCWSSVVSNSLSSLFQCATQIPFSVVLWSFHSIVKKFKKYGLENLLTVFLPLKTLFLKLTSDVIKY